MHRTTSGQTKRTKQKPHSGNDIPRFTSFDYLRLFAMILVTLQHGMAVAGYYEQTTWENINLGQVGVGLFCALSGYLAFSGGAAPAIDWLKKRLWQIYPAYWITTIAAFLLTWAAGTKSIDGWLFLSQMAGTGYFTHGWELINVVSWFISLILLCYVIAFICKWLSAPRLILIIVVIITLALLATRSEVDLSRHILSFCVAGLIAQTCQRPAVLLAVISSLLCAAFLWPQSFYAAFSIALLALALAWHTSDTWLTSVSRNYVYEYFLVHGIFLVGFARFAPQQKLLSGTIAITLAIVAAVILKKLTERLVAWLRRYDSTKTSTA
ncbi:acyltransferase family protein [Candidatus Nitrotoga sp. M5]|uniref:acyltransferase family protein n=1 Tax=Candidatus Nitrotoga sp. M5 TaxID=2890409 RepID=UPI001EF267EE|nr:acyltransferase [Candidatus Nitrotoga sp. M5]CAH1385703.1 Acyl_transf_3 domain-containing protein [Candidatus Nitrotoga sp. M5]